jgi:hypothetical protein
VSVGEVILQSRGRRQKSAAFNAAFNAASRSAHVACACLAALQKWGWVQEMYAFTIALYNSGIKTVDLYLDLMAQPPWDTDYALAGEWRCMCVQGCWAACCMVLGASGSVAVGGHWCCAQRTACPQPTLHQHPVAPPTPPPHPPSLPHHSPRVSLTTPTGKPYHILHYTYPMDYKLDGTFTPGKVGEWQFNKRMWSGKPIGRNQGPPPKGMKNDLVRHLINAINEATHNIPCWDEYERTGRAVYDCGEKVEPVSLVKLNV